MSEIKLTALVLLPADGDSAINQRVDEIVAECLDLADVRVDRPPQNPDLTPDNRWVTIDGKLTVADFTVVDLSPLDGTVPPDLLVQATVARFANKKPVLVLMRGEHVLPLGWHHFPDIFRYEADDAGYTALKKTLNRRLVTLVSEVEESLVASGNDGAASAPAPAPAAAGAAPAMSPGAASMPSEEEEARMKAVLRERFRRRLDGDVDTAEQAAAQKLEDKALHVESALTEGKDPTVTRVLTRPGGGTASSDGHDTGEIGDAAKRSRLLELQEKLKRSEV